ncbi:hypothetical protein [Arsenicibacter rosenii]|uniref:Outer membrane protein beta-barrel domain-containing protein n=1 Tax=Arsenicibacter rosenii TaxID=1750698 RepID=A0A1S2VFU0_9BACT|nr:hypothetical protein [Arsenicibacter rosenii]OIN57582.1 hypothetical protein BLX24_19065 [Arsenicibacter rosenii]
MNNKWTLLILATATIGLSTAAFGQRTYDSNRNGRGYENEYPRRYDDRYDRRNDNYRAQPDNRELQRAYDEGYQDGRRDAKEMLRSEYNRDQAREKDNRKSDYKNFTFGVYTGANSTRFEGEDVNGNALRGRLGWQFGAFVRGGGRLYGQIGAEYLTSSSDFYQAGDGASVDDITSQIDLRYVHVPAYIGFKLAESKRGISAVRLQVGAEFATPVGNNNNKDFGFERSDFQNATLSGLANLGFDAGPLFLDLVYHHGFADVLKDQSNSKRRILGVNVGLKF